MAYIPVKHDLKLVLHVADVQKHHCIRVDFTGLKKRKTFYKHDVVYTIVNRGEWFGGSANIKGANKDAEI